MRGKDFKFGFVNYYLISVQKADAKPGKKVAHKTEPAQPISEVPKKAKKSKNKYKTDDGKTLTRNEVVKLKSKILEEKKEPQKTETPTKSEKKAQKRKKKTKQGEAKVAKVEEKSEEPTEEVVEK